MLICLLLNDKDDRNHIIDVAIIWPNIIKALSIKFTEGNFSAARIKSSSVLILVSQYLKDRDNLFDVNMLWTYLVDVCNAQIMLHLSIEIINFWYWYSRSIWFIRLACVLCDRSCLKTLIRQPDRARIQQKNPVKYAIMNHKIYTKRRRI